MKNDGPPMMVHQFADWPIRWSTSLQIDRYDGPSVMVQQFAEWPIWWSTSLQTGEYDGPPVCRLANMMVRQFAGWPMRWSASDGPPVCRLADMMVHQWWSTSLSPSVSTEETGKTQILLPSHVLSKSSLLSCLSQSANLLIVIGGPSYEPVNIDESGQQGLYTLLKLTSRSMLSAAVDSFGWQLSTDWLLESRAWECDRAATPGIRLPPSQIRLTRPEQPRFSMQVCVTSRLDE